MVNRSSTVKERCTTWSTMLSTSDDSASARNPTCPRFTPSSGTADSSTHSAPRRMVPSPPSTTISSMPSSGRTGLASGATTSASRGSIAGRSSGGKTETMPAALSPSTSRLAALTAAGRPVWVSTATRRCGSWPLRAAAGSVTGPA